MTELKPKILLEYDESSCFREPINEIKGELSKYFEVRTEVFKSFDNGGTSFYLGLLLLSSPIVYFSKGFFTKIGENLGNEVSADLRKGYRIIQRQLTKMIARSAKKEIPIVIIRIPIRENQYPSEDQGINGIIRTNDEKLLCECFDRVEELYHLAKRTINEIGSEGDIVGITFKYNVQTYSWEPQYCTKVGPALLLYRNGKWEPRE